MLLSILTRKCKVPRHGFHPLRSRSRQGGGRSQLAAPQGHFHPAVIAEGARRPRGSWPAGSSGRPHRGGRSLRPHYSQMAAVIRLPRWGWRRGSLSLQDLELASEQPWRGLWSPTGSSLFPGAPSSPTDTAEGAEEP